MGDRSNIIRRSGESFNFNCNFNLGFKHLIVEAVVRQDRLTPLTTLKISIFGKGPSGSRVPLPNPAFCTLHLAIARVLHASGESEMFEQFFDDEDEDGFQVPVYFGGPFVCDDVLMRKLEVLAFLISYTTT